MNLTATLFPSSWHWVAAFLSLLAIVRVLRHIPWKMVLTTESNSQRNLLFGFVVTLGLFWSMKAGVQPGLNLHILGAMAATLALGPQLAVVAMGLSLTVLMANGEVAPAAWAMNFVLMVLVPVLAAQGVVRLIERLLPQHFFVFIFVIAFMGAAITVIIQGAVASLAMVAAGAYTYEFLMGEYLPYFILLGFSEAWISGAVITLLVVYKPEWVAAFDDRRYLAGK